MAHQDMSHRVPALVPTLAGAIAATAVMLLVGWPGSLLLTETADLVAAAAIVLVTVLVVVSTAAASRRPHAPPAQAPVMAPVRRLPARAPSAAPTQRAA